MPVHMIGQPKGRSLIVKKPKSCLHSDSQIFIHNPASHRKQKKRTVQWVSRSHPLLCHFAIFKQIMGSVISCFGDPTARITAGKEHQRCRRALMNGGALVNGGLFVNINGMTPLMFAVEENHPQCVKELIKAGADVNVVCDGYTALILAARKGMTRYAKLLIKAGAHVNMENSVRNNALCYAAEKSHYEFIEILLKAGADVNPGYGNFPIVALNSFRLPYNRNNDAKRRSKRLKSLKMLIKAGADVNVRDRRHLTALMSAAGNGYVECIRVMVKAGADVNAKTPNGKTALVFATLHGSMNCIKTLLEAGADVNARQNKDGGTALIIASRYGCYESMDALLAAGADVNAGDKNGYNALHLLAAPAFMYDKHYLKCAKKLLKVGIYINRIHKSYGTNALGKALEHDSR